MAREPVTAPCALVLVQLEQPNRDSITEPALVELYMGLISLSLFWVPSMYLFYNMYLSM